ncbi:MAG: sulfotransferase [Hyphomonadaceae bacterium]|nr:sulfotransferase [Hyphomonadaceae bacterium]
MPATDVEDRAAQDAAQWRAHGDALHAHGDATGGAEAHLRALAASTRDPAMVAAAHALNGGDLPVAERLLKQQLKNCPTDIGAMRMLAELAIRLGRYGDARALLDRALDLAPTFDAARFARALALSRTNRLSEALEDIDALLAKQPDNLSYLNLRATILVRLGDYEAAHALYTRVLDARPDQPKIWMSLGHVLKTMGRTEEGVAAYRRSLAQRSALGESWWSLANLKTYRFADADIAQMEAALAASDADEEDRLHLHFALGKAYEDRGEHRQAFEHYEQGNSLRKGQLAYDPAEVTTKVASAKKLLTAAFFEERRGFGADDSSPIFVVGLPRSGSTLIEQILASHPSVEGTMELPDLDKIAKRLAARKDGGGFPGVLGALTEDECRALGEEYIERTRIQRRLGRPFFIDKLPNNWLNVGLVQLILPNAKIVDARRHPMACCFSAWKQHFARGQAFTYDLNDLSGYYCDYVAHMAHIDGVLPGRVHRVIHEDLVADPEAQVRRLLDYLGLPFDERCLTFYQNERAVRTASSEQVRRPISADGLDQWRRFEPWLGDLARRLEPVWQTWMR